MRFSNKCYFNLFSSILLLIWFVIECGDSDLLTSTQAHQYSYHHAVMTNFLFYSLLGRILRYLSNIFSLEIENNLHFRYIFYESDSIIRQMTWTQMFTYQIVGIWNENTTKAKYKVLIFYMAYSQNTFISILSSNYLLIVYTNSPSLFDLHGSLFFFK